MTIVLILWCWPSWRDLLRHKLRKIQIHSWGKGIFWKLENKQDKFSFGMNEKSEWSTQWTMKLWWEKMFNPIISNWSEGLFLECLVGTLSVVCTKPWYKTERKYYVNKKNSATKIIGGLPLEWSCLKMALLLWFHYLPRFVTQYHHKIVGPLWYGGMVPTVVKYNHEKGHLLNKTRYRGCDGISTMASCEKST